jgi:hypothetical protein
MDVYIYKLDLNVEKPVVEKFPAQIREGAYDNDEVIRWIGPNDYSVWHSEFDIKMLGVVYEPLDNIIELIVKRDKKESESITMIDDYCCKKAASIRKKLDMYYRGIGAATIILYEKFGWFKWFYHDILGWHKPTDEKEFDGCNTCSHCKYCGKEIMQDSQGNWF